MDDPASDQLMHGFSQCGQRDAHFRCQCVPAVYAVWAVLVFVLAAAVLRG